MSLVLTSCIKDEPLNAEADIERVVFRIDNPGEFFFQATDTSRTVLSTDSLIVFQVRSHADVSALAPVFTLTPGATVQPGSGEVQDFSSGPVTYTVTSQDGRWQRRYRIAVVPTTVTVSDTVSYDFEHYELDPASKKFYIWHDVLADGTLGNNWASGNSGYRISRSSALPDEYPTVPLSPGYDGDGVQLTTCDTGPFGVMVNKRIAAGNLFLGVFDIGVATREPLQATLFGIPFANRPVSFSGYYKYTRGAQYQDRSGNVIPNKVDSASIYAVLYRNHDNAGNEVMLHGDDVLTNPNIVALARVRGIEATTEWKPWNIRFTYYTDIDEELLHNMGYNLTIVFSSSYMGDLFEGAIGSQLCIDKVRLVCTREE